MRTATVTQTDKTNPVYDNPDEFSVEFFFDGGLYSGAYYDTLVGALDCANTWVETGMIVLEGETLDDIVLTSTVH
jgi:hypothetical protein